MTLDTARLSLVSDIATYLQTVASDVNSLWAQAGAAALLAYLEYLILSGETEIAGSDIPIEVINLTCEAATNLTQITGARSGYLKILLRCLS